MYEERTLSADQKQTLARLQLLLRRRCLAESASLDQHHACVTGPIHALDEAIVGLYRLARALDVGDEADALLAGFRAARFISGACLDAPRPSEGPPDSATPM